MLPGVDEGPGDPLPAARPSGDTLKVVPREPSSVTRLRALGYGALVAVVVFYYLAVPTLRELIGPAIVLPAYVAVAVLAGILTYHVVRYRSERQVAEDVTRVAEDVTLDRAREATSSARPEPNDVTDADRGDDRTVDELLEDLEASNEE